MKILKWVLCFLTFILALGGIISILIDSTKEKYVIIDENQDRYY